MSDPAPSSRLRAARTILGIAWHADRPRSVLAVVLFLLEALVLSLFGLWLKWLLDGVQNADTTRVTVAALGMAATVAGSTALTYFGKRTRDALTERAHHLVERRLIDLVAQTPTLEIHETPAHLTQLELLEDESWEFGEVVPALMDVFTTVVRIVATLLLLWSVHPLLLVLPLFGLPAMLLSSRTSNLFRLGSERAAEPTRRANYLFDLATTSGAGKELRMFRLQDDVLARFHAAHRDIRHIHWRVNVEGELIGLGARLVFLVGFFGAIVFVVNLAIEGRASVGDAALTAVLAGQVLGLVAGSANMMQFTWRVLAVASRYVYLEHIAARAHRQTDHGLVVPERIEEGIRLDQVSYRYPLAQNDVLHDISLDLPAGATVAIVGDNGAGKTTLVKVLAGLYEPTAGRILLDGIDMMRLDPTRWRQRISAGFQDHARWEFTVREVVGIGDLATPADDRAISTALERAGASDLVPTLPAGLDTQLGPSWASGIDLSGGQWQKLALGRAMMRTTPLLLLLDEPTAALDADTEHRLFERWTTAAHTLRQTTGAVTVLVSHRFSTVQMADLIVVLDEGRIVETGTHAELIARRGLYAELFSLQAQSYR
jgi:ATP-binding cassette, subfamily B, bacterial